MRLKTPASASEKVIATHVECGFGYKDELRNVSAETTLIDTVCTLIVEKAKRNFRIHFRIVRVKSDMGDATHSCGKCELGCPNFEPFRD